MRRKVGLFGGSFDPIHAGHIRPVQDARRALGLERVIYMPTAVPPHKPGRRFAPAHARFAMVELALLGEEGLYASPLELTVGRPSYTVETVETFRAELPDAHLHLLLGSDSFVELPTWRRWRDLVDLVRLVVLVRPGWELASLAERLDPDLRRLAEGDEVDFVADRPVASSSSELRRRLALGEPPPAGALPGLVLDYLAKYALYR